jgi:hypothetical protein
LVGRRAVLTGTTQGGTEKARQPKGGGKGDERNSQIPWLKLETVIFLHFPYQNGHTFKHPTFLAKTIYVVETKKELQLEQQNSA